MNLWNKNQEKLFFDDLKLATSPNQLFNRTDDGRYVAYWPRNYKGKKSTLQARNSLVGDFTEEYVANLFKSLIGGDYQVLRQVQIPALGISSNSPADVVVSSKNKRVLAPEDVKLICEVKMSIVWNWEYDVLNDDVVEIGDYRTHQGKPSFTRSDSVLKAIGKCIDIRVSSFKASKIPIVVVGNVPLSNAFCKKADYLKKSGIIQGFWSLNPFPLNHGNTRKRSVDNAFIRFDEVNELYISLNRLFNQELNFFSGMENPTELGKIIELANMEISYENKGLKFLNLLKGV